MIGFGQEWTFGGTSSDYGYSVQQTTDGGYIITGMTGSLQNYDVYLIKTNDNGLEQWSKTFVGTSDDRGSSVQQTTDGGYIIAGTIGMHPGGGNSDVYLIKTDDNGLAEWSQTFDESSDDMGSSVQQTTDGGYIIAGTTDSDVYLIKTDDNGLEQWSKTFGGTDSDWGNSVQQTTDGGYIITGASIGMTSSVVYLIKTDDNGLEQWSKTFGGTDYDYGSSVQQTTDGGYIITGYEMSFGNGSQNVYLIKTDGSGNQQWSQTFGGTLNDIGWSVQQTTDGGYVIAGTTASFGNGIDVYLIKTDDNGLEQWSQTFGGTDSDWGNSVQQTTDGGYIITGGTDGDVYLIKTDGSGNVTSTFNIPINPNRKLEKTVDILGKEAKPKTNIPFIEIYDDGTVEKRIVIE